MGIFHAIVLVPLLYSIDFLSYIFYNYLQLPSQCSGGSKLWLGGDFMRISNLMSFILFCLLLLVVFFVIVVGLHISARQDNLEELKTLGNDARIGVGSFLAIAITLVIGGAVALVYLEKPINLIVLLFGCLVGSSLVIILSAFSALLDAYGAEKLRLSILEHQRDRLRKELDDKTKH